MRLTLLFFAGLLLITCLVATVAWRMLSASLPRLNGEVRLTGLSGAVTVERDEVGVARIVGSSHNDVVRALGFIHAQDRFFQMDLARRMAAGELAALIGRPAVGLDRQNRVHGFRALSREVLANLPERHASAISAYTEGVNAGLASLGARPPEYFALRTTPSEWQEEDCLLIVYSMVRGLNFQDRWERDFGILRAALPEEIFEFLTPDTTRFDAPMLNRDPGSEEAATRPLPIPGPQIIDVRTAAAHPEHDESPLTAVDDDETSIGSNAWAVGGVKTTDGRAIMANDMHLGLSVPGTWQRAQLEWGDERVAGVTLPGVPAIVAGTSKHVAWGYTNVYADVQDFVVIDTDPNDEDLYRTPEGWEEFEKRTETIEVRGGDPVEMDVRSTRWGPIIDNDWLGSPLALRWSAHDAEAVNLAILDMKDARNLDDAIDVARSWNGPPQNVTIADSTGRVGWVVSGWLPQRAGIDGRTPESWSDPGVGWSGQLSEEDRPILIDPPDGVIWSANNRTTGAPQSRLISRSWAPSVRASIIRDRLREGAAFTERDMLALQLDTRAPAYDFYRDLALEAVAPSDADLRALIESWNGRADADQRAYRLLRTFRAELRELVLAPLLVACRELDPGFSYRWPMADEPLMRLLEERPAHLLSSDYVSWDDLLAHAFDSAVGELEDANPPGVDVPWGEAHQVVIQHPISRVAPFLSRFLDMPREPLPGDSMTIRVGGPGFGASQRTVVSPGRESDGILQIPAGQSGHFMSRFYRKGHDAWVNGDPSPLLSGEAEYTLRLVP